MPTRRAARFAAVLLALLQAAAQRTIAADHRLIEAAKARQAETVRTLLREGVDVNATYGDGSTALHWAAYWDDLSLVDLLLAAGARVDTADDHGVTPLWLASSNGGSRAIVERLLGAGA